MLTKRQETVRLKQLARAERELSEQGYTSVAGVDEVGRGPLAGPVVAAACLLPEGSFEDGRLFRGIDDSKKVEAETRERLYQELVQNPAVFFGIGIVEAAEIDRINIYQATFKAMQEAVLFLKKQKCPDFLLIDGRDLPEVDLPSLPVIRGDAQVLVIAAASILAKVTRDRIMKGYDALFPHYGFKAHKGYGTKQHLEAIKTYGPCPIHRKSFGLLKAFGDQKW